MKVIFHIDVDAFFASCEEINNPKIKHFPVIVANNTKKSVVSSCNYNARKLGIHSGMPLFKIKNKNKIIIVKNNIEYYHRISNNLFNFLFNKYTKNIEILSIDEWYMDVTKLVKNYKTVKKLAEEIKFNIKKNFQLNVTIGISYNKFLAKMATNLNKPDNIGFLIKDNFQDKLNNLKIEKIYGIGIQKVKYYNSLNIFIVKELVNYLNNTYENNLNNNKNKYELDLFLKLNGKSDDNVIFSDIKKSVSHELTLENPIILFNSDNIKKYIWDLSFMISKDLIASGMIGNLIKLKLKCKNQLITKQKKINSYIYSQKDIYEFSIKLLDEFSMIEKNIYLIGISLSNLSFYFNTPRQTNIFQANKNKNFNNVLYKINRKYNKKVIGYVNKNE